MHWKQVSYGLLIAISFLKTTAAQELGSQHYAIEEGLLHPEVFRVIQHDSTRFLWIGTDYGLHRFDGRTFEPFIFDEQVQRNAVLAIQATPTDTLVVSYYREGLFGFVNGELFNLISQGPALNSVVQLTLDGRARVWAMEKNQLAVVDQGVSKLIMVNNGRIKDDYYFYGLTSTSHGDVYCCNYNGVFRFDAEDQPISVRPDVFTDGEAESISSDLHDRIWVATKDRLIMMDSCGLQEVADLSSIGIVNSVVVDHEGRPWLGTRDRNLYCFHQQKLLDIGREIGSVQHVNDLCVDHESNVWVATSRQGLFKVTIEKDQKVHTIHHTAGPVRSIAHMNGKTLFGSMGAVYESIGNQIEKTSIPLDNEALIYWMKPKNESTLWIGTNLGVFSTDPADRSWDSLFNGALDVWVDNDAEVLIGTYSGLSKWTADGGIADLKIEGFGPTRVNTMVRDQLGALWIGSDDGLFVLDSSKHLQRIKLQSENRKEPINDLLLDGEGALWVATNYGVVQRKEGEWNRMDKARGLLQQRVNVLVEDQSGTIWAGTMNGLSRLNAAGNFERIRLKLPNNDREVYSMHQITKNELWVGTYSHIVRLYLDSIQLDEAPPLVHFTAIETYLGKYLKAGLIELPYAHNHLRVDYTAVDFDDQDGVLFEYRLLGNEGKWIVTKNRSLAFEALEPGNYTMELRAREANAEQPSKVVALHFAVLEPWWRQIWFLILVGIAMAAIGSGIHQYRVQRILTIENGKQRAKDELYKLKQKALQAMMNPHFIFNSLNAIQYYIIRDKKKEASIYISNLARLIRKNLRNAEEFLIPLEEELQRANYYLTLEKLRLKDKFDFTVASPENLSSQWLVPNMLLQPYLENAIWHGLVPGKKNGFIRVLVDHVSENELTLIIQDNGPGFVHSRPQKRHDQHEPLGMKISAEMLKYSHLSGRVKLEELVSDDGRVIGTAVRIMLHRHKKQH